MVGGCYVPNWPEQHYSRILEPQWARRGGLHCYCAGPAQHSTLSKREQTVAVTRHCRNRQPSGKRERPQPRPRLSVGERPRAGQRVRGARRSQPTTGRTQSSRSGGRRHTRPEKCTQGGAPRARSQVERAQPCTTFGQKSAQTWRTAHTEKTPSIHGTWHVSRARPPASHQRGEAGTRCAERLSRCRRRAAVGHCSCCNSYWRGCRTRSYVV